MNPAIIITSPATSFGSSSVNSNTTVINTALNVSRDMDIDNDLGVGQNVRVGGAIAANGKSPRTVEFLANVTGGIVIDAETRTAVDTIKGHLVSIGLMKDS